VGSDLAENVRVKQQSPPDWDIRFRQQARWTENLRQFIFSQPEVKQTLAESPPLRVLETGCGTGAVTSSLYAILKENNADIHGLDIHRPFLQFGQQHQQAIQHTNGDVYRLPYANYSFDITVCHFLLLWLASPNEGLAEICRVTRPGGWVVALAEPDYGGRIDYPEALQKAGMLQAKSLQNQGADPNMGRKLSALFHHAGIENIQTGVMGGQWNYRTIPQKDDTEWQTLTMDLETQIDEKELERLKNIDRAAWQDGSRILFVPTFYAWGQTG